MTDFDFSEFAPEEDDDFKADLATITADAEEAIELERQKAELLEHIKMFDARINHLLTNRIPRALNELGLSELKLADGSKVTMTEGVTCGQLDETKPHFEFAKQWLIDHDASELLKTKVELEFGRGAHNEALSVVAELKGQGYDAVAKETIHSATYKSHGNALLKEYHEGLKHGEDVEPPPFEQLGMFVIKQAKIKVGKK